ncbi:hypothetical protein KBB96_06295 [Luteolibacter ambystomatis]|uniref:Uncharacterized protein n=1 Tax=Luteolibacter ambystomatis TaxID=2824561 RepID=A0A975J1V2_9BACT|nr:hypothetical protein [Luteolibacter ambystomatis]QUE52500.1 hypothetical protein KBB96_06295 [Luteolibacter ambystomatis]
MLARSLNDFHQWLFFSSPEVARSIVIEPVHRDPEVLAWAVACELNERNPAYEGRWISFLPDLLEQIAADPCQRHLLAIPNRQHPRSELAAVCTAILRRGYVVLQGTVPATASASESDVFQVAMGDERHADLYLSASAVPNSLLPARIADGFIDWDRTKNPTPAPSVDVTSRFGIRNISQSNRQPDWRFRFSAE